MNQVWKCTQHGCEYRVSIYLFNLLCKKIPYMNKKTLNQKEIL